MLLENTCGLLTSGTILADRSSRHLAARKLEDLNLLLLDAREYVDCVNPGDFDIIEVIDRSCSGRLYIDPANEPGDGYCPRCGRDFDLARKERFFALAVSPLMACIRKYVRGELERIAGAVREHPEGVYRLETKGGEALVCLYDVARDNAPLPSETDPVIFVVADDVRLARELPRQATVFTVADIALSGAAAFEEAVRAITASGRAYRRPVARTVVDVADAKTRPIFPLPAGVKWSDVTIYYVDGATIGISAPGMRPQRVSAVDLGLAKANSRGVNARFKLLAHLCCQSGRTNWRTADAAELEAIEYPSFAAFKMQAHPLRRDLQRIFGMSDDPYASFGEQKDLVTAFRALPEAPGDAVYVNLAAS